MACFSYNNGKCFCLTSGVCLRPCRFYKTVEELEAQRVKVAKRLEQLPEEQRERVRKNYYNGGKFR